MNLTTKFISAITFGIIISLLINRPFGLKIKILLKAHLNISHLNSVGTIFIEVLNIVGLMYTLIFYDSFPSILGLYCVGSTLCYILYYFIVCSLSVRFRTVFK